MGGSNRAIFLLVLGGLSWASVVFDGRVDFFIFFISFFIASVVSGYALCAGLPGAGL